MYSCQSAGATSAPCNVLIIEDHPDGRETLRVLLEVLGHRVEVAADGVQGVEKALAHHPDIALVDIGLPRLDGYQVAQRLRAVLGRDIFLIAQTGYSQPEDRGRAFAAGFDVHLGKPLSLDALSYWLERGRGAVTRGRRSRPTAARTR